MKIGMALGAMVVMAAPTIASAANQPPAWTTQGPHVSEQPFALEVPLEVLATKLFVEIELGGKPRRFVFDTGSPSMMSAALAAELQLEAIDKTKGRDSHGAIIETSIVQSDLTLGDVTFRKVPIFVADFPHTAGCLFDGVIGSELLPLCAWQIDLPDGVLRCNSELSKLDHVDKAGKQPLYAFGYPHAPVLDLRFADKARSKAMFDTGSSEYLVISPADLGGAQSNGGVVNTIAGNGSLGGSLGGQAPNKEQQLVQLKSLKVGNLRLGSVVAPVRESAPSLVGAALLEHFVVTLDARSSAAYFDRYRDGPFVRPSYGFGLGFEDAVSVSLLWQGSPAEAAGLQVGQRLTSIDGQPTSTTCAGIRNALRAVSDRGGIDLEWEGGSATLDPKLHFPMTR